MLRIISGIILLIISQISFASVFTSTDTVAATATLTVKTVYGISELNSYALDTNTVCTQVGRFLWLNGTDPYCTTGFSGGYSPKAIYPYSCTDYVGSPVGNSIGDLCKTPTYTCPSGYTLSGTNCTKTITNDSCASYAGQKTYLWVSKTNPPSTVCDGTCVATASVVAGFPDALPNSYQGLYYTYTGETGSCTDVNTGWVDEATATAANAAADAKALADKIQKAIDDAITACGGTGHYTLGTFNGNTVITCKESTASNTSNNSTTTNITNNSDGSTTTTTSTTTNNNTTVNNGTSTTVNSDGSTTTTGGSSSGGSSSSSGGSSGGSIAGTSGTTTTTTTTNPDGSSTSTTSSASSTILPGTAADYDYKDSDRNDWNSKNFQTVIQSNIDKLKGTALYGSVTGFFAVSFNGSCSASNFNASYQGASLSGSFDWCSNLAPFQVYIKAVVIFLCSWFAFRRAIE